MNQESQNIEWKENWRDEYLKWICGFANAQGGRIYIGKNDKGLVVGRNDIAAEITCRPPSSRPVPSRWRPSGP